jgi:hypothetical protein
VRRYRDRPPDFGRIERGERMKEACIILLLVGYIMAEGPLYLHVGMA